MAAGGYMCAYDQPDSLEGWVAIKEDPFTCEVIPPRLLFLVSWNDVERKVAVTCRLRNRVVSDTEEKHGRSGLFSFQELRGVHELLCLIHPSLSPYLPDLPEEPWGIWAYVSYPETPENIDDICEHLQTTYFPIALETCKEQLLMSTMFEEHSHEEYFENISELKRQAYDQAINNAKEELKNVLFERTHASNMAEMADIYKREDEAVFKLNIALAELFNYLLQPYLDLREVACHKVREAKMEIQNPDNGQRVRREFSVQLTEWQGHYEQALDNIQDSYMKYYSKTRKILQEMQKRLEEDRKRFGSTAFQLAAQERLFRVKEDCSLENLQYLHNKKIMFVQERDKVKETIASTDDKPGVKQELQQLEDEVFDWQIKIYDLHLDILREEEKLAKTQKEAITRVITDVEDEVVFYDAVEDVNELSPQEDAMPSMLITDPRLRLLNTKLKTINTKRAKLRNKRANLKERIQGREGARQEYVEKQRLHHQIQMKRDQQKEELEKKQGFISEQRKRAIDRLKTFNVKYPTPATIKPPRYQPPSARAGNLQTSKGLASSTRPLSKTISPSKTARNTTFTVKERKKFVRSKAAEQNTGDNVDGANDIPVTIYVSGTPSQSKPEAGPPSPTQAAGLATPSYSEPSSSPEDTSPQSKDSPSVPINPSSLPPSTTSSAVDGSSPVVLNPLPDTLTCQASGQAAVTPESPGDTKSPASNIPPPPPPLCIPPPPPPPPPPMPTLPEASPVAIVIKKKTSSLEAHQKMQSDKEVGKPDLQQIQFGLKSLRPASQRPQSQKPKATSADPMAEMVNLIKKGVRLRPMKERKVDEVPRPDHSPGFSTPSEDHMKLLVESLNRINVFTRESSPESDSDDGEFDD